ncbi:MAG: CU044_5270 family protein [Cellulosimicrobium cellulans]
MDDLQLLREMRSDIGSAPSATLARGRTKLMARIDSASRPGASERTLAPATVSPIRFRRRVLLASAAAALLVGGIVAADVVLPARPGATAEAAEVLNNAAAATIQTSDPVVGPGQYLKIETISLSGGSAVAADGSQLFWQEKGGGQVYVPADRDGEWVWNREESVPVEFSSEAAKAEATRLQEKTPSDMVGIKRGPRGAFYGSEPVIISGMPLDEAAGLPRDPQTLLSLIQERTKGAGKSPEIKALGTITAALRTGVIPADLRAAFYKAAALIPGVTVVDKQATIDGRTGIAIGIPSPDGGSRQETIIDPATGLLIGERNVMLKDYPGSPAGTIITWTSVRTSVVNSAP